MTKKNVKVNYNGEPLKADEVLVFTHQSEPPNTFFPDIFLPPLLVFYFIILVHFFSIHPRLKDVIIENRDFENLIKTYDRPSSVFFVDPPYVSTEKYYNKKYCNFTVADHRRLNRCLTAIKGRFILTYNDCDFIRDLYKDYNIQCVTRNNLLPATTENRAEFKEIIITNFVISSQN